MRPTNESGVTLIELLIAMAIGTLVTTMLYSLFVAQSRGMRQAQQSSELEDNARIAMQVLVRDIRNAGFLTRTNEGLRIEDNCGATGNKVDFALGTSGPDAWVAGGSATGNAVTGGDIVNTVEKDGCPNGSDRIELLIRPRNNFAQGSSTGQTATTDAKLLLPCVSNNCTNDIFQNGQITGTTCGSATASNPTVICLRDDATHCLPVVATPDSSCSTCAAGSCALNISTWDAATSTATPLTSATTWSFLGGKALAAFNAYQGRIYQLMDLDGDGSTELVFSDTANASLSNGLTSASGNWTPVANYIDDLQFAFQFKSDVAGNTWHQSSLWNFPGLTTVPAGDYSLTTQINAGDPPVAVRVTVVARSARKEFGAGSSQDAASLIMRPQVENNSPAGQAFNPAAVPSTGAAYCYGSETCGCGPVATRDAYMRCTGNGNAQGFRRRIMTQVVGLRNTGAI